MKCELCHAAATVHVTNVGADGVAQSHSLCESHAFETGFSPPQIKTDPMILEAISATDRKLADFLRKNRRMPVGAEAIGICGSEIGLPRLAPDIDIDAYIEYLEAFADFIDLHGRYPTNDEVPDAF